MVHKRPPPSHTETHTNTGLTRTLMYRHTRSSLTEKKKKSTVSEAEVLRQCRDYHASCRNIPIGFFPWNIEVTLCLREHFHPDRGDTENSILSGREISVLIYIRQWHILPYFMKKQRCPYFPSRNRDKINSILFICVLGQPVANRQIWNVVNSKYQARESPPKFSHWTYREFHITWK